MQLVLLFSVCVALGRAEFLRGTGQELQDELHESERGGTISLAHAALMQATASDDKERQEKFSEAANTIASAQRRNPEDRDADEEIAQAMQTPSEVGTPEAPPEGISAGECYPDWSSDHAAFFSEIVPKRDSL